MEQLFATAAHIRKGPNAVKVHRTIWPLVFAMVASLLLGACTGVERPDQARMLELAAQLDAPYDTRAPAMKGLDQAGRGRLRDILVERITAYKGAYDRKVVVDISLLADVGDLRSARALENWLSALPDTGQEWRTIRHQWAQPARTAAARIQNRFGVNGLGIAEDPDVWFDERTEALGRLTTDERKQVLAFLLAQIRTNLNALYGGDVTIIGQIGDEPAARALEAILYHGPSLPGEVDTELYLAIEEIRARGPATKPGSGPTTSAPE